MKEEVRLQAQLHGIQVQESSDGKAAPELTTDQKAKLDARLKEIQAQVKRG